MIQVKLFTQKSILVVLLVSKRNQQVYSIFEKIKNVLLDKGLDENAAAEKTTQLLQIEKNTMQKLEFFYSSSGFFIKKSMLIETLAKYALYEKKLDLNLIYKKN